MRKFLKKNRFLEKKSDTYIISVRQFGSREGASCVTDLISFCNRVVDIIREREGCVDRLCGLKKIF